MNEEEAAASWTARIRQPACGKRVLRSSTKAAAELNAANAKLDQYKSLGTLSPWFGGPYAALTINAHYSDKVFGKHNGVLWSFHALCERVNMLEHENASLRKLADKPMKILDDAQGYYTVTDPFDKNASITVKQIVERNARQWDLLKEHDDQAARARRRDTEQSETIQRKDEKILEQAKEIKALKLSFSYDRFVKDGLTIADLAGKLRQTQEDLGDMTVAHNEACETIDKLNARLDKIDEMALDISHVADGSTDPEEENGESVSVDFETRGVSPVGWDFGKPGGDFTVVAYVYDPVTGEIKRKD